MSREKKTDTKMEIKNSEERQCCSNWQVMMSPEIVEIGEEIKSSIASIDEGTTDVFVAVGKNDLDVVKWVLNHAVLPGTRVFLIHVFSPMAYIPTPVGRLSRSQLSKEQLQIYINEENNRRRNLLQKYINLCTDAKVAVDTMLVESNAVGKAILDLIPVVNITNLFMGTKRPPSTRLLKKGLGKAEYVQKNAPENCGVTIIYDGKKHQPVHAASKYLKPKTGQQPERNFFECMCFTGKFS